MYCWYQMYRRVWEDTLHYRCLAYFFPSKIQPWLSRFLRIFRTNYKWKVMIIFCTEHLAGNNIRPCIHGTAVKYCIKTERFRSLRSCSQHAGRQIEKAWESKSKFRAMLIVFLDIRGVVMENLVPGGVTKKTTLLQKDSWNFAREGQEKEVTAVGKEFSLSSGQQFSTPTPSVKFWPRNTSQDLNILPDLIFPWFKVSTMSCPNL